MYQHLVAPQTSSITQAPALPTQQVLQRRTTGDEPLTTVFTVPSSCLDAPFTMFTTSEDVQGYSSAWRDRNETSAACYPPDFYAVQFSWHFYSPGVCPVGYETSQTSVITNMSHTATRAWCCPAGMTISGTVSNSTTFQYCSSFVTTPTSALVGLTTLSGAIVSDLVTGVGFSNFYALQWPLSVEWQASDLPNFTPQSAPILDRSNLMPYTGLRTDQRAGLAVGVVLAGLLLAGVLLFMLHLRRKRRRRLEEMQNTPQMTTSEDYDSIEQEILRSYSQPSERRESGRTELDTVGTERRELRATRRRAELEGEGRAELG